MPVKLPILHGHGRWTGSIRPGGNILEPFAYDPRAEIEIVEALIPHEYGAGAALRAAAGPRSRAKAHAQQQPTLGAGIAGVEHVGERRQVERQWQQEHAPCDTSSYMGVAHDIIGKQARTGHAQAEDKPQFGERQGQEGTGLRPRWCTA